MPCALFQSFSLIPSSPLSRTCISTSACQFSLYQLCHTYNIMAFQCVWSSFVFSPKYINFSRLWTQLMIGAAKLFVFYLFHRVFFALDFLFVSRWANVVVVFHLVAASPLSTYSISVSFIHFPADYPLIQICVLHLKVENTRTAHWSWFLYSFQVAFFYSWNRQHFISHNASCFTI